MFALGNVNKTSFAVRGIKNNLTIVSLRNRKAKRVYFYNSAANEASLGRLIIVIT